jgi:hypothetical protein
MESSIHHRGLFEGSLHRSAGGSEERQQYFKKDRSISSQIERRIFIVCCYCR